jgi:UDP-N-acetylmuramyl pentapeptide phosphotransferase/UDP-N-acetylglucosamine-1-phosphate transferase
VLQGALRTQHVAQPTERGLHKTATPVGGGLGMMAAALTVWVLSGSISGPLSLPLFAGLLILAAVSWIDDRQPLPPMLRFASQAVVAALLLWAVPSALRVLPALPLGVERLLLAVAWMWVINLTNFMDGIDGLAGTEAITVGMGYALVSFLNGAALPLLVNGAASPLLVNGAASPLLAHLPELGAALAGAAAGYLVWNWHPARIFMGDVGSIPLGLIFGLLMLDLATRGHGAAALILPMYFLGDATLTLLQRLQRGDKPWQAHREHAYQCAVLSGISHSTVTLHVAVLNVALVALAVLSLRHPLVALVAALGLTGALLHWFRSRPRTTR